MSSQNIAETRRLIKVVEKYPFDEEDKKHWLDALHADGISVEMIEDIHKKFLELPAEKTGDDWTRARENMEITSILKQLRLAQASRNFKGSR